MDRARIFKSILWAITGLGAAALATRFLLGLSSVANLSDAVPWGIWKGFNVFPGIALAGGGFVMTAIIYIVAREEYHKYAKVSVLLAFLGYLTAATALVTELGLPWMVWHPLIYWQHHSALFEVSWCVMLYLTVLFLEFIPVPLEETSYFAGIRRFLTKYKIVLVFLGIMISTLHQSSLGSMWLITPEKLHPLWYTSLLPILFLLSAVAVGPLMLILAILVISYLYHRKTDGKTLAKLGFLAAYGVLAYGLVRIIDIGVQGKFPMMFDGSWQSTFFLIEISLMVVIPLTMLGISKLRNSNGGLWIATICSVIGLGFDRANIAGIMLSVEGPVYTPTIFEVFISLSIVAAAMLAFLFGIERFKVWDTKWVDPREKVGSHTDFDRSPQVWSGTSRIAGRVVFSLLFVIFLAVGFAIIPGNRIYGDGAEEIQTKPARGDDDTLYVDGNRDSYGVMFKHKAHCDSLGGKESCTKCHHMNMPLDKQSGCYNCHKDMYSATDAFGHDWHGNPNGGNLGCFECHTKGSEKSASSVKQCGDCHLDLIPAGAVIVVDSYTAPSYADAMHVLCVTCHSEQSEKRPELAKLTICTTCHESTRPEYLVSEMSERQRGSFISNVVMPGLDEKLGKETD